MDLLAGAAFAECGVYVILATYFILFSLRKAPESVEFRLFSLACAAMAFYAVFVGLHFLVRDDAKAADWVARTVYPGLVVAAASLHLTLLYAELEARLRRIITRTAWLIAAVLAAAQAAGLLFTHAARTRVVTLGALSHVSRWWQPRPSIFVLHGFFVLCAALTVAALFKAMREGKREARLAISGASVMAAAVVNDVLVAQDVVRGISVSEHAFGIFAFGLSYTLLARYVRFAEALDAKGAELRKRAQKLRRAYEELRAAQEELVRKEQLAVIGELAAVVSHEVRNPLAIIRNAVAGLRRAGASDEDREMLLGILDEETAHLNHLVGDLLRYARPIHIERQPLDLDTLVGKACELAASHTKVKLERVGRGAELPDAHGDANLIRQVLDNLVQNACQAMPEGGTLTVRLVSTTEEGRDGVAVEVADTGEGMDTIVRSRARTPFFTTRPAGTGLGLAICDRIVTAHGGLLVIKSRALEGTVVRVFLPAGSSNMPSEPTRSSAPPPSSRAVSERMESAYVTPRR
jgi:signal transduction histidine kinase